MSKKTVELPEFDLKGLAKYLEKLWWNKKKHKFNYWNERLTQPITKKYKISICTNAMDRLENIKKTYIKNIEDNLDYSNVEFVLLDYNSKDGLEDWAKQNLMGYINKGIVNFYRTTEPKHYSMTHSRNVCFKLAQGDIVNNVDSDNYTNKGFVTYINKMANQYHGKVAFAKSRQKLRGRLGFFKKDFIEILNGYDEEITGYGGDDQDLLFRALEFGFTLASFRAPYFGFVKGHVKHKDNSHYLDDRWWYTEGRNKVLSFTNLLIKKLRANDGKSWGKATVVKNFKEIEKI